VTSTHKTIIACVALICAAFAVSASVHNIYSHPEATSVTFYKECAGWSFSGDHKKMCAELSAFMR
jgi:hypothetical protein